MVFGYKGWMTGEQRWDAVDTYFIERLAPDDAGLDAALANSDRAGLPAIAVAPNQGKLLQLLATSIGARSILEIGTLGGYSTIWLARALPGDGRLISLESDARHVEVAKANIERAGLSRCAEVLAGKALDTLPGLTGRAPFDLTFIDADKPNIPDYFRWALELSRPGSPIVVDNVVRGGAVADTSSHDPSVRGIQQLTELIRTEPRVSATAIQTVGVKGYDGFLLASVST